jgi:GNAT superfamily N-acetyltransferase
MTIIHALTEADLPEARRIVRVAFGTFLGAPDPGQFWSDLDYVSGRFGAEHTAAFAAENDEGVLVGSNFATRWGSVGFFGPLTTRPDFWDGGIGQRLVAAAYYQLDAWGVRHAGLFTFAQSAKHVGLYGKLGFHPRFLTAIMTVPASTHTMTSVASRYSALPEGERQEAEDACRELTEELYPGLDLRGEIRTVAARALGDTALLWDQESRLAGFAVCHWGPASEAGEGCCYVKFGAVRRGAGRRGALRHAA